MHETHRLSWDGAVDADGHILEPSDLWETYLEPQYRDRALRVVKDENGLDELSIGGQRSTMSRRGFPSTLASMGRTRPRADGPGPVGHLRQPRRLRLPRRQGAPEAARRRAHRRRGHLHHHRAALGGRARRCRALAGLLPGLQPLDLRLVLRQRGPADPGRPPVAHGPGRRPPRSWSGPSATAPAAGSWRRSRTPRCPSAIPPTTRCSPPHRTSTCPSPSTPCSSRSGPRAAAWAPGRTCASSGSPPRCRPPTACATSSRRCSTTACSTASPRLKILVLESGGGWIGYWLDRMDGVFGHTAIGERVPLANPPSHYFQRAVLDQLRPRRAEHPGPRRALRRRPVHVGVGLPARSTTPPSTSTTSTARRHVPRAGLAGSSWATTAASCSRSMSDRPDRRHVAALRLPGAGRHARHPGGAPAARRSRRGQHAAVVEPPPRMRPFPVGEPGEVLCTDIVYLGPPAAMTTATGPVIASAVARPGP